MKYRFRVNLKKNQMGYELNKGTFLKYKFGSIKKIFGRHHMLFRT